MMFGLNQRALHWRSATSSDGASAAYGTARVLRCRWESHINVVRNSAGEEQTTSAVAYLGVAVARGDKLALGNEVRAATSRDGEVRMVKTGVALNGKVLFWKAFL